MDINDRTMRTRMTGAGSQNLAWYVRHEYGDRDPTWFLNAVRAKGRSRARSPVFRFAAIRRAVRTMASFLF